MEDIKCEQSSGGSLRHLNTFSNLVINAVHYTYQHMLLMMTVPTYTMLSTTHSNTCYY